MENPYGCPLVQGQGKIEEKSSIPFTVKTEKIGSQAIIWGFSEKLHRRDVDLTNM
jgi:hypothetical protein